MTDILLLHHIQGLTPGVRALADALRAGGHTVHTPDLFEGRTFDSIDEGFEYARNRGFDTVAAPALAAADDLPDGLVVAGISFGVMGATRIAVERPGVAGLLCYEGFADPAQLGTWRDGVPAQVHGMDGDPFFAGEGDLDAARAFADGRPEVDVFTYPGSVHLFLDSSLRSHDPAATQLVVERSLTFLAGLT
ncbi:dienelactone hydrolase family protein [Phycicoccus sp. CSK15P-2]|uniref:dienelactone hydrolase family protein n=1 Tax=Phycicoccus sp. CSK15P-2 TaxID=2807627 RepID=UPI00194F4BD3|nr:dienelactone hydrolase family protein [Phycicoccus sp. CSK15P-2]MBM6406056.1 dienelactone hydrolase family protein [Phycicoccus sp. CSK15P-2]